MLRPRLRRDRRGAGAVREARAQTQRYKRDQSRRLLRNDRYLWQQETLDPVRRQVSLAYLIATAIVHGSVRLGAFTDERLNDPVTESLLHKVDLYLDPDIDATFPGARSARIRIETLDGTLLEHFQPTRKGDPDMPFSDDDVSAKFTELVVPVTGDSVARALLERCWSLKTLGSVRALPMTSQEICESHHFHAGI